MFGCMAQSLVGFALLTLGLHCMRLIGWITTAITEKDGLVHQDSLVSISAAAVTQEIYQVKKYPFFFFLQERNHQMVPSIIDKMVEYEWRNR